jgi:hypothetical protein
MQILFIKNDVSKDLCSILAQKEYNQTFLELTSLFGKLSKKITSCLKEYAHEIFDLFFFDEMVSIFVIFQSKMLLI